MFYELVVSMPTKYVRKIIEVGHSVAVTLPKPWVQYFDLKIGDKVEVIADEVITIKPLRNNK